MVEGVLYRSSPLETKFEGGAVLATVQYWLESGSDETLERLSQDREEVDRSVRRRISGVPVCSIENGSDYPGLPRRREHLVA